MRFAECGAHTAEGTQLCANCGAPVGEQRSTASPRAGGRTITRRRHQVLARLLERHPQRSAADSSA